MLPFAWSMTLNNQKIPLDSISLIVVPMLLQYNLLIGVCYQGFYIDFCAWFKKVSELIFEQMSNRSSQHYLLKKLSLLYFILCSIVKD